MKLIWTAPAAQDRREIREFIAIDNPIAAISFDEMLERKASKLTSYPNLGRAGRITGTRELVVHRNYILLYDINDDNVRILRVLHTARQWPPLDKNQVP